jgi:RNA polymerase sigma-70 factor (ECF subfamily)
MVAGRSTLSPLFSANDDFEIMRHRADISPFMRTRLPAETADQAPCEPADHAPSEPADHAPSEPADHALSEPASLSADRIARTHDRFVRDTLARLRVPSQDVEDVAQDVLAVVVKRLPEFTVQPPLCLRDALRLWIHSICARRALDHARGLRKQAGRVPLDGAAELVAIDHPAADEQIELREDERLLARLVAELPPDRRAVWLAHEVEGRSMPEIARDLGIPSGTAWNRLRLARDELRAAARRLPARDRRRVAPLLFPFASEERRSLLGGAAWLERSALLFAVAAAIAWLPARPPSAPSTREAEAPVAAGTHPVRESAAPERPGDPAQERAADAAMGHAADAAMGHAAGAAIGHAAGAATDRPQEAPLSGRSATQPLGAASRAVTAPRAATPPQPPPRAPRSERVDLVLAREALAFGQPAAARSFLSRHQRAFPQSRFAEERDALSARAHEASGR